MTEWTIKYSTKNGAMYTHPEKGIVEMCKESISKKTIWRVSEMSLDRTVKDVHGLSKKVARALVEELVG